jgi:hypothetical protein
MRSTRRKFIGLALAASGAASARRASARPEPARGDTGPEDIRCLDFGRSFICHKGESAASNAVRFWVESRTALFDDKNRQKHVFYQCGSCKSEHTFAAKDFRRKAHLNPNYRSIAKVEAVWGVPLLKLHAADPVVELDTWDKIRAATDAGLPLVTQTEITDDKTGLRAVIECPTKTMNIEAKRRLYQVDTGPVAYPDLSQPYDPPIACLRLAFLAFNAPDFADFVVEQPTPVLHEGKEVCKIHHYSAPFSVKARNVVLAIGKLP